MVTLTGNSNGENLSKRVTHHLLMKSRRKKEKARKKGLGRSKGMKEDLKVT